MTAEKLEAQDEVLRQAWKEGALKDEWYNNWIEKVYSGHVEKIVSSNNVLADSGCNGCRYFNSCGLRMNYDSGGCDEKEL